MKKEVLALVLFLVIFTPNDFVFALDEGALKSKEESFKSEKNTVLSKDVFIDGIPENSTLYVGADIKIKGYVDSNATKKEIEWKVTGKDSVIDFSKDGNKAYIKGKEKGRVWVMARALDGSDRSREYTVNVSDYPSDNVSKSLIALNIVPVLKRSDSTLLVEVKRSLSLEDKKKYLDNYFKSLVKINKLKYNSSYLDDYYEYFSLNSGKNKIEIRVDRFDISYSSIKDMILNIDKYNSFEEVLEDKETDKRPEKPEEPKDLENSSELKEDNEEEIKEEVKEDVVKKDPIIITFDDKPKKEDLDYIKGLIKDKEVRLIRKFDLGNYTSYLLRVFDKGEDGTKNDFSIEIRVKKDDKVSYESVIEMLDKDLKVKEEEKDTTKAKDEVSLSEEKEEEIKEDKEDVKKEDNKEIKKDKNEAKPLEEGDLEGENIKELPFLLPFVGLFLLRRKHQ
ncbi:hypothetical protein [Clostridium chrysemydis]|uniref:hypothetical protein n=1 Tax=Clostridium chrysemydis TaxID=2665504 RepID=UPI001883C632|nr:hypothetical protein [Clostridium chrysemydis]